MTISVDIKEQDLMNLVSLNKQDLNLHTYTEQTLGYLFEQYPFTLYKDRMMGNHMVTIQIQIKDYFLFALHGLVK